MAHTLIRNTLILTMTGSEGEEVRSGNIGITDGRISFIGGEAEAEKFRSDSPGLKEIDGRGKLAMPGLINTHNHISMTLLRGYADDLPLMKWLNDYIWPFEAKMTRDDIKLGAELGMAEMLLGGTTTSADMYWMEEAVGEAAVKAGMRVVVSPTLTDSGIAQFERDLEEVASRYGSAKNSLITFMIAPHSVYTCSPDTLLHVKKLADKYGAGINIHVSETLDEQKIVRERHGKTPIELLDSLGILDEKSLMVHCVYVNDSDIKIMSNRRVSMAYNPQSNMKLAGGIAPVQKMIGAGINVAFGTDGPSSNNDLDMWEEMRSGSFLQKVATLDPCALPAYKMLKMSTVNGAKALGLEGKTGELRKGLAADIIVIDLEKPHMSPQTDIIANLAYCAKGSDIETVIVGGKTVVEHGKLLTLDIEDLMHEAQKRVGEIKKNEL